MPISFDALPKSSLIIGDSTSFDLIVQFDDLGELCRHLNTAYRSGEPLVSDALYDQVFLAGLRQQQPDHPYLHNVEPEPVNPALGLVQHATPMLSTAKAYSGEEVAQYVRSVTRAAHKIGINPVFSLTQKLDGVAANDAGTTIATRGDGLQGSDITAIAEQGVVMHGGRGQGRGEIVIDKAVFDEKLGRDTEHGLEHARNFVSGYLGADTLKPHHRLALAEGAIHFIPFSRLKATEVDGDTLIREWETLFDTVTADSRFLTDGVVVTVTDPELRAAMGATNSHERAVLAIKKEGDSATTRVEGVRLTVGRTGRIIPTLLLESVYLSGANIAKATAHTVANLTKKGLGEGALVRIVRAGEVIPYLQDTLEASPNPVVVSHCPVCNTPVVEDGEHTVCPNATGCSAQTEATLHHWFHTLGNVDGFGRKTVQRLAEAGKVDLPTVYAMTEEDFAALGFGDGQARNLVRELARSREEPVRDWRWLAAFGIRHLGRGDARKLLAVVPLTELEGITEGEIAAIDGFGSITSGAIATMIQTMWPTIEQMLALDFNLQSDADDEAVSGASPISGKRIVFTGTMATAKRKELEQGATEQGAQVQSAVSAATDWLVIGDKAGSKLDKAKKINESGKADIEILTEASYLEKIA